MKIGGGLDFTADFGLKVSQVTAGFGYREGYYHSKAKGIDEKGRIGAVLSMA